MSDQTAPSMIDDIEPVNEIEAEGRHATRGQTQTRPAGKEITNAYNRAGQRRGVSLRAEVADGQRTGQSADSGDRATRRISAADSATGGDGWPCPGESQACSDCADMAAGLSRSRRGPRSASDGRSDRGLGRRLSGQRIGRPLMARKIPDARPVKVSISLMS